MTETPAPAPEAAQQGQTTKADAYTSRVYSEYEKLQIASDARKLLKEMTAEEEFEVPPSPFGTMAEGLLAPRPPRRYLVEDLLPEGGNVLLAAQYKTGKTTLVSNLVASLTDGEPFLGRYAVRPLTGRVALFDYELDDGYAWEQLAKLGIQRPERGVMLSLRGYATPFIAPVVKDWAVAWLTEHEVEVWIVDPFGAVFSGEENSNDDVREWLKAIDEVKRRAGVRELILVTHTGRMQADEGQERARGATRLDDWPDARWTWTRDATGADGIERTTRFLAAHGRGVDVEEFAVDFDPATLRYSAQEHGGNRAQSRRSVTQQKVFEYVRDNPRSSTRTIRDAVGGNATAVGDALKRLVQEGQLQVEELGKGLGNLYSLTPYLARQTAGTGAATADERQWA